MIDKQKFLDRTKLVLASLHAGEQSDFSDGAISALEAIVGGIEDGVYDIDPPAATRYTEEDLDTDTVEHEVYGVFLVFHDGSSDRSPNVPKPFDTRSEAWAAVRAFCASHAGFGLETDMYEVRPL